MTGVGLWQIQSNSPKRLQVSTVGLEQDLETWIENDPNLLEHGLAIVARQLRTDGGPLDLLGLDIHGRWVLIEIKRDRLKREVIAQAIDYASCLERYESNRIREQCNAYLEPRGGRSLDEVLRERGRSLDDDSDMELLIYLVGTGIDTGLERMVGYLSETANLSIRIVTFSVYEDEKGNKLLAREIHEPIETDGPSRSSSRTSQPVPSEDEHLVKADQNGVGNIIRPILKAVTDLGLHPRRYSKSFMIAPPQNRTRCLFYLPIDRSGRIKDGKLGVMIVPEAFEQFFGVPQQEVKNTLCPEPDAQGRRSDEAAWVYLDENAAEEFANNLRKLLA